MPKSRKHKTNVKKKTKPSARRRKTYGDVPIIPLLESTTEKETRKASAGYGTIATLQAAPAGKKGSGTRQKEIKIEDFADVFEERANIISIISIVKGLEEQVDTAFKLKEDMEAELDTTQKKLSEELVAHMELEAQVKSLEAQAALVDQLREGISLAEEERNKLANLLAEIRSQSEAVAEERDSLVKKAASAEAHAKDLRVKLASSDSRVSNLRIQIEEQQSANRELMETRTRLECELKMSKANHEATRNELEMVKKALNDLRSEATLVSGRVRRRHFNPKDKK